MTRRKKVRPPLRGLGELTQSELRTILAQRRAGVPYTALSRRFGVAIVTVIAAEKQAA